MKYQIIFLSVVLVGALDAINLSGLLSDSSSSQSTNTTSALTISSASSKESSNIVNSNSNLPSNTSSQQLTVNSNKNKKNLSGLRSLDKFLDSDYQNALTILNDATNNNIYDSYLASIRESFMTYYVMNAKAVKKIAKKRLVVDLSALEELSNQSAVKKKVKHLSTVNLGSLTDVTVVKNIQRKEKVLNIDQLLNNTESLVVVKKTPTVHTINFTDFQQPESSLVVSKKSKADKITDLSSLASLNQTSDTDVRSTPVKKNKTKKRSNLSSLLNN